MAPVTWSSGFVHVALACRGMHHIAVAPLLLASCLRHSVTRMQVPAQSRHRYCKGPGALQRPSGHLAEQGYASQLLVKQLQHEVSALGTLSLLVPSLSTGSAP